jgi:uncharacterized Zn finger protein
MEPHRSKTPNGAAAADAAGAEPQELAGIPMLPAASSAEAAPPIESMLERFWLAGPELEDVTVSIQPPERPLELLEKLGPSPFERGTFPLIGFLATTYDKVSRYALSRK